MAISSGNVLKRPKVVEESQTSDSEDSQSNSEEENEVEPGDVEIKEELDDDNSDGYFLEGDSFTAVPDEDNLPEVKEEEEEESEDSGNESKEIVYSINSRTKKVKNKEEEKESDGDDFSDMSDDSGEGESEDDNFGDNESEKEDEEDNKNSNSGLANMMAKILATKKSDNVILSKAKTDKEVKKSMKDKNKDTFEIVDSSGQIKSEPMVDKIKEEEEEEKKPSVSSHDRDLYKKLWEKKFRKKPSITEDREKERKLRVLATQGVVQLFSAIEKHKTMMQVKLSQCRSIMGREKILESTGKEAFLDILKQQGKRVKMETDAEGKVKEEKFHPKEEVKEEAVDIQPPLRKKTKWNVLSDNFYKEPTLQGWDQQSDDEED